MAYETILIEREGAIATIVLNRPKALNALNATVLAELVKAFDELEADKGVRAVVITGSGDKAFAAGADIGELNQLGDRAAATAKAKAGHKITAKIEHSRLPVIMAINGFALGGGLEVALACDLRVSAETTRFGFPGTTGGPAVRLAKLVGVARAKHMALTGQIIDALEAERLGLLSHTSAESEVTAVARKLAKSVASRASRK